MTSAERRRELRAEYERRPRHVGIYALRNSVTGRVHVASALDLDAVRSKLEFARATKRPSVLDHRLTAEIREFGIDAFTLEVLDELDVSPDMTPDAVRADLNALEVLWRERVAAAGD